ncbi:MAG: LPS assembly lipoprotein LptE [Gammaproteobacteria bacterium]
MIAVLGGCGFRLAGTSSLPEDLNRIYLVTSEFDPQQQAELRGRLQRAGADVSLQPAADRVKLSVRLRSVPDQRVVTSAGNGQTVKRVVRQLDYSLRDANGQLLAPERKLTQQTDLRFDDDNLLSSSQERDAVVEELEKSLYEQLIRQLQSI